MVNCLHCKEECRNARVCLGCLAVYCGDACRRDNWREHQRLCANLSFSYNAEQKQFIGIRQGGETYRLQYVPTDPEEVALMNNVNAGLQLLEDTQERLDERTVLSSIYIRIHDDQDDALQFDTESFVCRLNLLSLEYPLQNVEFRVRLAGEVEQKLVIYNFEQLNALLETGFQTTDIRLALLQTLQAHIEDYHIALARFESTIQGIESALAKIVGSDWKDKVGQYVLQPNIRDWVVKYRTNFNLRDISSYYETFRNPDAVLENEAGELALGNLAKSATAIAALLVYFGDEDDFKDSIIEVTRHQEGWAAPTTP